LISRLTFVVYRAGKSHLAEESLRARIVRAALTDLGRLWEQEVGEIALGGAN